MTTPGYDGSIKFDTSIDTTGFNKAGASLKAALSGLVGAVAAAFTVTAIINFGKQTLALASTVEGVRRRFITMFGAEAPAAGKALDALGAATNFCDDDLRSLATTLINTFHGLGLMGETASGSALQMTKLAEDVALFWDQDPASLAGTLQMAMMGMYRGLRQYGVSIDETMVKQKAQEMQLYKGTGALDQQARALATAALLTEKFAYASGYAEASTRTWSGQVRGIAVAWEDFKKNMGAGLMAMIQAALPLIQTVMNFLVKLSTIFSQIMSTLFGVQVQTSAATDALQATAGAADDLADSTTGAGKAAKGALAAFDQLNVLQQPEKAAGGAKVPAAAAMPKTAAADFTQTPGLVQEAWAKFSSWFQLNVINPVVKWFKEAWKNISGWAVEAWIWVSNVWNKVASWFQLNVIDPVVKWFKDAWAWIGIVAHDAWLAIVFIWDKVAPWFQVNVIDPVLKFFKNLWDGIVSVWNVVAPWFQENVLTPLEDMFKKSINAIIGFLNGLISGLMKGINATIKALNTVGIAIPGWVIIPPLTTPKIPTLAQGAVIPPNAAFAAILGDQRSGKNIEAPESLIRQIIREELNQSVTITMPVYLDSEKISEGQKRVQFIHGPSLVEGAS